MKIGTQYYRPPHPQRRHWSSDLAAIKAHGFFAVRTWLYWRTTEREPGRFDWSDCDAFFNAATQAGLQVVVQLVPEVQPAWFLERYDQLRPRLRDGSLNHCLGMGMCTVGSYPGILYDQPVFQEGSATFYSAAAEHFRGQPGLVAWDAWNEIMPHSGWFSFDAVTTSLWQDWLQERFGSIEHFNELSFMEFQHFRQIPLFDGRAAANEAPSWLIMRFYEFLSARATREMARRVAILRAADPMHPIYSHTQASMTPANDDWSIAHEVDSFGTSQYCSEHVQGVGRDMLVAAADYSAAQAAAPGRPWWLAEVSGGQTYYLYGHYQPSASEIRANLVLAAGFGAKQAFYWQYRAESFGQESPGWGLAAMDGQPDDRMAAVAELAEVFSLHRGRFESAKSDEAPVVVLYDRTTQHLEASARAWVQPTVTMEGELLGWFEAVYAAGSQADVQRREGLEQLGVPPKCRVYVLPMHLLTSETGYSRLLDWVEKGGQLVLTPYSGHFGEDLWLNDRIPGGPFADALDLHVLRRNFKKDFAEGKGPLRVRPHSFIEELHHGEGFEVAFCVGEQPLVLTKNYGRGRIHYFASLVGTGYRLHGGDLSAWLGNVLGEGKPPAREDGEGVVLCRTATDAEGKLYFLVNPRHSEASVSIRTPARGQGTWSSLTSSCTLSVESDGSAMVTLAARDGAIVSWQIASSNPPQPTS